MVGGPFEHYSASPTAVGFAANQVTRVGVRVDNVEEDVARGHRGAVANVAGLLHDPMVAAAEPVYRSLLEWLQATVVAGSALQLWAQGIEDYNRGIDRLNDRYDDAAARFFGVSPEPDELMTSGSYQERVAEAERRFRKALDDERYYGLSAALNSRAYQVVRLLRLGPGDPRTAQELHEAGVLPPDAQLIFPGLAAGVEPGAPGDPPAGGGPAAPPPAGAGEAGGALGSADGDELAGRVIRGQLSSLAGMTEDEQFAHFTNHPDHAAQVASALLPITGAVSAGQATTLRALGRYHAWQAQRALEMYPSPAGLAQIEAATERLVEINERLAAGGELTEAERAYLAAWLEGLGPEGLAGLAGYVADAVMIPPGTTARAAENLVAAQLERYLSPVADAIMNLSHPERGGFLDPADLPAVLRQLMDTPMGERDAAGARWPALAPDGGPRFAVTDPPEFTVAGLARYDGFGGLLSHATTDGGTLFLRALAESADRVQGELAEIAAAVAVELPPPAVDPAIHQALQRATAGDGAQQIADLVAPALPAPPGPDGEGGDRVIMRRVSWSVPGGAPI